MRESMNYMKKLLIFPMILLLFFLAAGCRKNDANIIAENTTDKIIKALENNDKEALEELFSNDALENIPDFDDKSEYLMQLFNGEFISKEGAVSEEGNISDANNERIIRSHYTVKTDIGTYMFFIAEKIEKDSDSNGLYFLQIIPESKKYIELNLQGDKRYGPGIFTPDMMNADDYMTAILWALDGSNSSELKTFFSHEVTKMTDLANQCANVTDFYKGKMKSFTAIEVSEERVDEIVCIKGKYRVKTDEENYIISFVYKRDDAFSLSDGLYSLSVITDNDETNDSDENDKPGIYFR